MSSALTARLSRLGISLAVLATLILLQGCSPRHLGPGRQPSESLIVLYDNDVHCSVDGYPLMAALKSEALRLTDRVCVVSSGDYVQGGSLGASSKGGYIVEVMNQVGYDAVTLGNHEFDYGMERLAQLSGMMRTDIVCCNLFDLSTGQRMYQPYKIMNYGDLKVAFVGIATPYSFVSSTPSYFQNEEGEYVYSLSSEHFYETVQSAVDDARAQGVDYVIVISHLGDDESFDEINSMQLAYRTSGIDVILDGHSHSVIPGRALKNKEGKDVILTSTGANFQNVGRLTISPEGIITTELVSASEVTSGDPATLAVVDRIKEEYAAQGSRVIGVAEAYMEAQTPDVRIVRFQETGLGDFCTDAIREIMRTDICLLGGGSVRTNIEQGTVTYDDIFRLFPFNNTVATAEISGRQILDALEFSVSVLPVEFGGFLQVSGLKFDVDVNVWTPVTVDVNKMYTGMAGDQRRVMNVMFESAPGVYEPLDPERIYTVSGTNYLLKEQGDGYAVLNGIKVQDTGVIDLQILEQYIVENLSGVIPARYGEPQGRINIIQ